MRAAFLALVLLAANEALAHQLHLLTTAWGLT